MYLSVQWCIQNIELKNRLQNLAQSEVTLDENAWREMRDTYEAVVLQDHAFSEKHKIEGILWRLHYEKIAEFRACIGRTSVGDSVATQDAKSVDRSLFKRFLSEATGFYHDLILKIRAKYGFPLVCIAETPENQAILAKDANKSGEMQKGLISCHRCLVYLGDLARYKVLYAEGYSAPDFSAASSYYMQAASLWPSGGSPHHQLAVLALYSGDHLVAVYRYFRSLAVDFPLSSARDHLFVAFENNRKSYSNCSGNAEEQELTIPEILKAFSTRFVRLNDILFTKTSLETFGDVFSMVISNLGDLLSSGPEEELNFGQDAAENELYFVRLIVILVCTVHNVHKESEGQSYAENAFSLAFEFVGHILKRCVQLNDVASSYLLPAVLVFMKWLACHPDIATRRGVEVKEATARTFFWEQCISLMDRLVFSGFVCVGDNECTTCFSSISMYNEGETNNRFALSEDFELRGFTPLKNAQLILDFSQMYSIGSGGRNNEKETRLKRILASGKVLLQAVGIDQQGTYYDSNKKKFVIGIKPPLYGDQHTAFLDASKSNDVKVKQSSPDRKSGIAQLNEEIPEGAQLITSKLFEGDEGGDDDDEEIIVYQPPLAKNCLSLSAKSTALESIHPGKNHSGGDLFSSSQLFASTLSSISEPLPENTILKYFLNKIKIADAAGSELCDNPFFQIDRHTVPQNPSGAANCNHGITFSSQSDIFEPAVPLKFDSTVSSRLNSNELAVKLSTPLPVISEKNPVNSPVKQHIGPPSGFSEVPATRLDDSVSKSVVSGQHTQMDDYYMCLPSTKMIKPIDPQMDDYYLCLPSTKMIKPIDPIDSMLFIQPQFTTSNNNDVRRPLPLPFTGKRSLKMQTQVTSVNWENFQLPSELELYAKQYSPRSNPSQSLWSRDLFV